MNSDEPKIKPKITRHPWGFVITVPCPVCRWPLDTHTDELGHRLPVQPQQIHDGSKHAAGPSLASLRACLRCGLDLTDTMGCYVFISGRNVPGLLCIEHGSNGNNDLTQAEYDRLTQPEGTTQP